MSFSSWGDGSPFATTPFRWVFRPLRRPVPPNAGIVTAYTDGVVTLRANKRVDGYHEAADLSTYQGVEPGDFVVHGLDILRGSVGVSDSAGAMSPVCTVLRVEDGHDPRYHGYVIRAQAASGYTRALARGIREGGADFRRWDTLASLPLLSPPLETQRRIADMLDAETARIDTLIEKNERVRDTALLREKVAVSEAVGSGGLHVGCFPTGALRWFDVDIQTGPFGSQLHADEYVTGGWPVCNPSNIRNGRLVPDESVTIDDDAWSRLARHQLRPGDIIFGRRGEMGRAALVTEAEEGWVCGTGCLLVRLRSEERYLPEFLMEVLSSWGVRAWFDQKSVGSTMQNLNEGVLGSLPVPRVPVDEQHAALERIQSIRERHALIRVAVDRQQELLRLRRQALITAAVTGEIEV